MARLLAELGQELPADMIDKARTLDSFYVPARYPNGYPEGAPFEHYGSLQSGEAIRYAREIVDFVRAQEGLVAKIRAHARYRDCLDRKHGQPVI